MKQLHNLCPDNLVSPNDFYRKVDKDLDLNFIYEIAKEAYSNTGQSFFDPFVFSKIELVGFLEGIHEVVIKTGRQSEGYKRNERWREEIILFFFEITTFF